MVIFLVSFLLSLVTIPIFRIVSKRIGWVAQIRKDRWASRSVPVLGGAGMFIAFFGALLIGFLNLDHIGASIWYFLLTATGLFFLGLYDDGKKITPPAKLIWQLFAATIIIFLADIRIDFFLWPVANIILTMLWIIGITNAINLLDNMDGLAGGITVICSAMLGYFFWNSGYNDLLIISLALCGAVMGFLVYNFPPAKIFMGNNGSYFLGFLLAELAVAKRTQVSNVFAALGVPILLLLFPIIDTIFVMVTRLLRGQSPIKGGTDHTSHRLIAFGLSERQTLWVLYCVTLLSGIAAAELERLNYELSLIFIPVLLIALLLFTAHLGKVRVVPDTGDRRVSVERFFDVFTYKRRIFEILLDLVIIGFSYYLAYWTQYGLNMTTVSMNLFMQSWPIAIGVSYLAFFLLGVYQGIWGYLGVSDLFRYGGAALCSGGFTWMFLKGIYPDNAYTADIFIIFTLFQLIGLSGSRSSFQLFDQFYSRHRAKDSKISVLIYGVDEGGEVALSWMLRNTELGYKPIGFLDDKPQTWGKYIHNIKVLGGVEQIISTDKSIGLNGVILSDRSQLDSPNGTLLLEICRKKGIWIRVLHIELEDI